MKIARFPFYLMVDVALLRHREELILYYIPVRKISAVDKSFRSLIMSVLDSLGAEVVWRKESRGNLVEKSWIAGPFEFDVLITILLALRRLMKSFMYLTLPT